MLTPVLVTVFLLGGIALWLSLFWRVPYRPRNAVPWNFGEIVGVLVLWFLAPVVVVAVSGFRAEGDISKFSAEQMAEFLAVSGAGRLVAVALGVALLRYLCRATEEDLGISQLVPHFSSDLKLAALGLGVSLVPVYALQVFLRPFFVEQHVVIEAMERELTPALWVGAMLGVVIAAPIWEEFAFRLVLQGWLEKVADRLALGRISTTQREIASEPGEHLENSTGSRAVAENPADMNWIRAMPVAVSSVLFSPMHLGQGSAPFALLPLAITLGFLYYRTHRILPCILLHAMFNFMNLALLVAFQKFQPPI